MKTTSLHSAEDWSIDVEEVSAGVYKVTIRDDKGHTLEAIGPDPDLLVVTLRSDMKKIISGRKE